MPSKSRIKRITTTHSASKQCFLCMLNDKLIKSPCCIFAGPSASLPPTSKWTARHVNQWNRSQSRLLRRSWESWWMIINSYKPANKWSDYICLWLRFDQNNSRRVEVSYFLPYIFSSLRHFLWKNPAYDPVHISNVCAIQTDFIKLSLFQRDVTPGLATWVQCFTWEHKFHRHFMWSTVSFKSLSSIARHSASNPSPSSSLSIKLP